MNICRRLITLVLLTVMVVCCLPATVAVADNITDNINGWIITSGGVTDYDAYIDGANYASGQGSFKMVYKSGAWMSMTYTAWLSKANTYVLEFDAKSDNSVHCQQMFNNYIRTSLVPLGKTYDWTHFKMYYDAAWPQNVEVGFVWEGPTDGFWLDNIKFYAIDDESQGSYVPDGNFDFGMREQASGTADKTDNSVQSDENTICIYNANINIDGDLSDWKDVEPIDITKVQQFTENDKDISLKGNIRMAHDVNNLYVAIDAEDDIHYYDPNASYWECDSAQIAIAAPTDAAGQEFGAIYDDKERVTGLAGTGYELVAASRNGNHTIYEFSIPWKVKYQTRPDIFKFSAVINDNDGNGRDYCIELTPGISTGKDAKKFKWIQCVEKVGGIGCYLDIPAEYAKGEEQSGSLTLWNNFDKPQSIKIESDEINLHKEVTIPAGKKEVVDFKFNLQSYEPVNVKITVSCENDKTVIEKKLLYRYSESDFPVVYEKIEGYRDELEDLIVRCDKKDIPTDYETVNYAVIKKFLSNMKDEAAHKDFSRIGRYDDILTGLYNESKGNMLDYLSGKKESPRVPKYVTSDIKLDGTSLIATTSDGKKTEQRPVFFVGYGHWETIREQIPFFTSIGSNFIQIEGVGSIIEADGEIVLDENATNAERLAAESGYVIYKKSLDEAKEDIKRAAENNMIVSINIHPGIPASLSASDPSATEGGGQFIQFNVDHPEVRKFQEINRRAYASELDGTEGLFDFCITNEPSVMTSNSPYFEKKWQEHLRELYGTVENLNETCGTDYNSFSDCTFSKLTNKPIFYEYVRFNDSVFADYQKWSADVLKDETSTIKVHSKVMDYFDHTGPVEDIYFGSDYEGFADSMDVNGCDAFGYYDNNFQPFQLKMGWYDLLTSLKDTPVWNTEDHIVRDFQYVDYSDILTDWTAADIWNGAVHGRGGSAIWIWDKRDSSMPWGADSGWIERFQNSNFVLRPAEVAGIGKATLDINRLSNEITAIQKEKRNVGLLYSRAAMVYNSSYMRTEETAYEDILYNGQKVGFVTDSRPEDMHKYKVLVVPLNANVTADVLNNIHTFVKNGGKLIIADDRSLKKSEHDKENDPAIVNEIYEKAVITDSKNLEKELTKQLGNMGLNKVMLVDADTGEKVSDTEWSYAEYNGNIIVNVLNYDMWNDKNIKIMYNGNEVSKFKELRSLKSFDKEIVLKPYKPVLIQFSK